MAVVKVSADKPNSCAFFKPHWLGWKILGIALDIGRRHPAYLLYSAALNIMATIYYPVHLALALFSNDSIADNIKNLTICVTCVACSIKFIIYATKLQTIRRFELILSRIDESITCERELECFKRLRNRLRNIGLVFICSYVPVGITAELTLIFREERSLLYPAWFPFDWRESKSLFILANVYQTAGMFILLLQNCIDDIFPPMALCMLSGHIKMLSIRIANIGHDGKSSLSDNEQQLNRCIDHQQKLYELYRTIEDIISWPIFIQMCVSATNTCLAIALLFFASTPLDKISNFSYCMATQLQMFPVCYYGSNIQYLLDQLRLSVYSSNWIDQTMKYKKHMILFTERALKQNIALAGGMVRIHLDTFFASCRGAYSLLAIIMNLRQ